MRKAIAPSLEVAGNILTGLAPGRSGDCPTIRDGSQGILGNAKDLPESGATEGRRK